MCNLDNISRQFMNQVWVEILFDLDIYFTITRVICTAKNNWPFCIFYHSYSMTITILSNPIEKTLKKLKYFIILRFHSKTILKIKYRTRAIISRGLYFFYPFFTTAAAYTADNLCTKQGNVGLKSAAYKQERLQIKSGLW